MNKIETQLAQMEERYDMTQERWETHPEALPDIPKLIKALRRALKHFDAHLYPSVMADISKDLAGEEGK